MRLAAHDSSGGNVGSIQYDLDVPDFAKLPFSISGVVMTSPFSAQVMTVRPDEQLRATLPAPPVAIRAFPQNDEIALFAEVYDNAGATPHKVDISTTITSDEGKQLFKTNEERDSADLGGKSGGYGYMTKIPLKDIAPGNYVLTVSARTRLGNATPAERQMRISVMPPVTR